MKKILIAILILPIAVTAQIKAWGPFKYDMNSNRFYWMNGTDTVMSLRPDSVKFYKPTNITGGGSSYTFGGGLTESGGAVRLGGSLSTGTTLTLGSNDLTFTATSTGRIKYNLTGHAGGDTWYEDGSGNFTRLGIGTAGQVMVSSGSAPAWQTFTFNNGLTASGATVTWGGAITGTRTITGTTTADGIQFTGISASSSPFTEILNTGTATGVIGLRVNANSSNSGYGILGQATSTDGTGVRGNGGMYGLYGLSTANVGTYGVSFNNTTSEPGIRAEKISSSGAVNTVLPALDVKRTIFSPGVPTAGIGVSQTFTLPYVPTGGGQQNMGIANEIRSQLTNIGGAALTSRLTIRGVQDSTFKDVMVIDGNGNTQLTGGIYNKVTPITSNTTLTGNESFVPINANGGNITITLPAASAVFNSSNSTGWHMNFVRVDNTGNTVTIQRAGSDTINGTSSFTITAQWQVIGVQAISTIEFVKH
jgi:hypothetical protein